MNLDTLQFPQFYKHSTKIHSFEVDFNQKLTVTALFNYLQEIAGEHAQLLGYGWEHLLQKDWFWVLSRVEVVINRLPRWTEQVTLITWPRGIDGIFALRDFEMYDDHGQRIIAVTSSWLVLSIQTRRPVRVDWFSNFNFARNTAMERNAPKLAERDNSPEFSETLVVRVGDIDINHHVNNVRYIDWAYNTFSIDHLKNFSPSRVVVNFNAEGKANDTIAVTRYQSQKSESVVEINNTKTGKNLCRLLFEWEKI